jgi:1-deoxy-D-xylulose-5-phosphate reductoisomerase
LSLALEAGRQGGTYPAVLCAADEVAVDLFLSRRIKFIDISEIIAETLGLHKNTTDTVMENILAADKWARKMALRIVTKRRLC